MSSSIITKPVYELNAETELSTPADLRKLTDSEAMEKMVADNYGQFDIGESFESLVDCGELLQLALYAADEQPCSTNILQIISRYQNVVNQSFVTCNSFITSSIIALKKHQEALEILGFAENSDFIDLLPDALDCLAECFHTATEMEKKALEQAESVGEVTGFAEEALLQANEDHLKNVKGKKDYETQIGKMNAEQAANDERLKSYNSAIKELSEEKKEAAEQATQERNKSFALDLVGAVFGGVGNVAKLFVAAKKPMLLAGVDTDTGTVPSPLDDVVLKQKEEVTIQQEHLDAAMESPDADTPEGKEKIETLKDEAEAAKESLENTRKSINAAAERHSQQSMGLEEKASSLSKKYYEMLDAQRDAAALQVKNLEELKNLSRDKSEVERAIFLLIFAKGILGKVKTTFLTVKTFWSLLADDCKNIGNCKSSIITNGTRLKTDTKESMITFHKKKFKDNIIHAGQQWACVGRVCIIAYDATDKATKTVNGIMSKLPTGTVTVERLDELINQCEPRIKAEALKHKGKVPPKAIENS